MNASHRLVYNAIIYTSGKPFNNWMIFDQDTGVIHSVGQQNAPVHVFSDDKKRDYNGLLILPGLHDSHLHMAMYGKKLTELDLKNCRSIDEFCQAIGDYKKKNSDKNWIIGSGWEQDLLGRFPTAEDIDSVCPDVPVFLFRVCHHVGVANQKALDISGLSRKTHNISGAELEMYPSDHPTKANKPTGILKEIPLINEMFNFVPANSFEEKLNFLNVAIKDLLKNGITSAHPCESDTWQQFRYLAEKNLLPIRIFYSAFSTSQDDPDAFPDSSPTSRHPMLVFSRVKFFVDGALGPMTAAISEPYDCCSGKHLDESSNKYGLLMYNCDQLKPEIEKFVKKGLRIEAHVIGDRAAELVLDVLDELDLPPSQRPVFIHCQILRKDLIERMKHRGVIASIQPQFVNTDARWIHNNLPHSLLHYAYPWKTLIEEGILCAGGSDAPIEPPIALLGIFDAVFRLGTDRIVGKSPVFRPEERLNVTQAIDMYTKCGAFAALREKDLGELLPGYQADFAILDRNICADPQESLNAKVLETWVGGIKRWSASECN